MANRYDFDENEGFGAKLAGLWEAVGPRVTVGAVTLAVVVLGAVIWTSYPDDGGNGPDQAVPIVRADAGDFKTLPDDPGGMQIAHRDSTVFGTMGTGSEDAGVENLLADDDAEEAIPKSQLFAGLNTDEAPDVSISTPPQPEATTATTEKAPSIEQAIASDLAKTEPAAGADAAAGVAPAQKPEIDMVDAARAAAQLEPTAGAATTAAAETKAAAKEAEKAATVEPAAGAASAGSFYVQVGSVRELSGADVEWKKIKAKYDALNDLSHRVERADLGAKGTFYRIQAGPVSKDKAASTCDAIKKVTPGGCLVVAD